MNIICITTGILQIATITEYVKIDKKIEEPEMEKEYKISTLNDDIELEDEEKQYDKTLSYPKSRPYGNRKEPRLVKMIRRN